MSNSSGKSNFCIKSLVDETLREGSERSAFAISTDSKYKLVSRMVEAGIREFVLGIGPESPELLRRCLESKFRGDFSSSTFIFIALLNSWETTFSYLLQFPRLYLENFTLSFGMINLHEDQQLFEKVVDKFRSIGIRSFKVSILCNFIGGLTDERYMKIVSQISRCLAQEITTIRINDSLGALYPETTEVLCSKLVSDFPSADFCLHSHDDRGLALSNSLISIYQGFNIIEGSLAGLGNRAGLPSIELIDKICKEKEIFFENCQINSAKLIESSQLADEIFMNIPNVYRPVSGLFTNNVNIGVLNIPDYLGVQRERDYVLNASALHPKTIKVVLKKAGFSDRQLQDEEFVGKILYLLQEKLESIYLKKKLEYSFVSEQMRNFYASSYLTIEHVKEVAQLV